MTGVPKLGGMLPSGSAQAGAPQMQNGSPSHDGGGPASTGGSPFAAPGSSGKQLIVARAHDKQESGIRRFTFVLAPGNRSSNYDVPPWRVCSKRPLYRGEGARRGGVHVEHVGRLRRRRLLGRGRTQVEPGR